MQLIDIGAIIQSRSGREVPKWILHPLRRLIHEEEINSLITTGQGLHPQLFLRHVFHTLNVKYRVHGGLPNDNKQYIFVANHPFGGLDGMMLADILLQRYTDVGIVANDLLMNIEPLRSLWIPINKFGRQNNYCRNTYSHAMNSDTKQILTFPAGVCSRWINGRVQDMKWHNRFIKDAMHHQRQVIPIYIAGELSSHFYLIYRLRNFFSINTNIELILLADELFRQKGQTIDIFLGSPIDISQIEGSIATKREVVRQKVYELAK